MERFESFPVIAVKRTEVAHNVVCYVPSGAILKLGDIVIYSYPNNSDKYSGMCTSNTLYLDRETLDMVCRVTSTAPKDMPTVIGKIDVDWYTNKEVSNE